MNDDVFYRTWEPIEKGGDMPPLDANQVTATIETPGVDELIDNIVEKPAPMTDESVNDLLRDVSDSKAEVDRLLRDIFDREVFECHLEVKDVDKKRRVIEGYANTKNIDRLEDIIKPPVFKESLPYFLKNGSILLHHIPYWVVGRPIAGKIDKVGLWIRVQLAESKNIAGKVEETWELIEQRMLRAFSIGFRILPGGIEFEPQGRDNDGPRIRRITKLELFETSIVSIPANRESLFDVAKGFLSGSDAELTRPSWYGRTPYEQIIQLLGAFAPGVEPRNIYVDTEDEATHTQEAAKRLLEDGFVENYDELHRVVERLEETLRNAERAHTEHNIDAALRRMENFLDV